MADESFENAPLLEIVAELRWVPSDIVAPQAGELTIATVPPPSLDKLFNTFVGEVYQSEYRQIERLIPAGFPILLHQPAFRFRHPQQAALFQLGLGLFSANGLQPYRSWSQFRPIVKLGVDALLKARIPADRDRPFTLHSLRYIDAFGPDLLNGQTISQFVSDTLGLSLDLPDSVSVLVDDPARVKSRVQLTIPIKGSNKSMALSFGEGALPTAPATAALLMETTVTEEAVVADSAKIMDSFDTSRTIIHDTFIEMTRKIHPLMKPR